MTDPTDPSRKDSAHQGEDEDKYPHDYQVPLGTGGYDGRDPATDMPRVPQVAETQDEKPQKDE